MDISPKEYVVAQITGDYAMLRRTDAPSDQLNQVALALLPEGLEVGSRLRWEMFVYTLLS
ncbi:MAG: chorismate--pyruvate lyase [Clostridiales bacterium]|nr:chorismate--pyruvate lyase [Clostridiales bacterium]